MFPQLVSAWTHPIVLILYRNQPIYLAIELIRPGFLLNKRTIMMKEWTHETV